VLGVITFALVFNLLTLMDLAVEIQQVTKGAIILAAVLLQRRSS
jgi:ribose transport system permease protein